ncbi:MULTISPECIES: lytic polysaccharide monooxygenase auxiliary activity family 9 protein [Streptomyces]|uniref:Lytic polysaccharide monooxygenase n=1 Tax=Streptomyces tendae TaxID=1932 RepID=A0ABW7S2N7_STRTE|nr:MULTISPECIES: lytic polysaccharide monooxygenase [unclassified Streptomyces]MBQ0966783.1 lytic polysaccharide monooxygenase [Streptomyces sp. RK74B]MBQ1003600.1 lytic polysaccharide monooxygenase [Streptomyces sp. RK23]
MSAPSVPRRVAAVAVAGLAPLALTTLAAAPASAHGSMGDPVSRVSQCHAEGPENPKSAACKAAVAAGGTQALYDWNGIRIGNAAGKHQELIPDGKLCSANDPAFKGMDLARADWPATGVSSGSYTFKYRVTAPHKGTFKVYITKPGYDPAKPLGWGDLDLAAPVATSTDPVASGGFYTFSGTLPERSGKHLLYAVWQRSDSPEAFYSCSDVSFGGAGGSGGESGGDNGSAAGDSAGAAAPAPEASAPSEEQIAAAADKSTIEHHGHGDQDAETTTDPTDPADPADPATAASGAAAAGGPNEVEAAGGGTENLAETGGDGSTTYIAVGGAAALAVGAAVMFASVRRRAAGGRHSG